MQHFSFIHDSYSHSVKQITRKSEVFELHQLLEDIHTYRSDCMEVVRKEKKTQINKEKEDKEKGEELRRLALTGMASEFTDTNRKIKYSFDYFHLVVKLSTDATTPNL